MDKFIRFSIRNLQQRRLRFTLNGLRFVSFILLENDSLKSCKKMNLLLTLEMRNLSCSEKEKCNCLGRKNIKKEKEINLQMKIYNSLVFLNPLSFKVV